MQHDNTIENKLREMEAMEQPDLSQVDTHWQQMAAILQPSVLPVKKGWPKWMLNTLSGAAVAILIGAAIWYASSQKNSNKENSSVQNKQTPGEISNIAATPRAVTIPDSGFVTTAMPVLHQPQIDPSLIYDTYDDLANVSLTDLTDQDSVLGTISRINFFDCDNCPSKSNDVAVSSEERQLRLQDLFTQVKKEEQHFTINNTRDTILRFAEGTGLLIGANSFGGMNGIEITVKEFYKTSDIILNQLSTASNKEQLETGGMLYLKASYKGNEIKVNSKGSLTLFLPDTKEDMKGMQLFSGEEHVQQNATPAVQLNNDNEIVKSTISKTVNWKVRPQGFIKRKAITQVRVLNIADIPWGVRESEKKKIGYFMYDEDSVVIDKDELKQQLKEKYGYTKVKLTSSIRDRFISVLNYDRDKYDRKYSEHIGDSLWMDKTAADMYKLTGTATRTIVVEEITNPGRAVVEDLFVALARQSKQKMYDSISQKIGGDLDYRYSIKLSELGWINCDRFYADSRKKINYTVDLGDTPANYYTTIVFDRINSMMPGNIDGERVVFSNIPLGEPVKIISIGINQKGETVYSVTNTTTSNQEFKGLQFQTTSALDLKTALSKYDK